MRRMASNAPLSSLRLLIPPLRLLTAAMWQVARRQSMKNLVMLEDFVSLVTETVPQLLTDRQRSLLLLALRAKVALIDTDPQAVQAHLGKIHSVSEQPDEEVDNCWAALMNLNNLTEGPADRQRLLQEVFNYSFDSALQSLISDFLYKIEQLFPVPDFKQAAFWLDAAPGVVDDCMQEVDREDLRELLASQSCSLDQAASTVDQNTENVLLSAWSHPLLTKLSNPNPPIASAAVQSDPLPDTMPPVQLDVELVKEEEVVVLTEDELEEVEEAVTGRAMSPVDQEVSSMAGDECAVNVEVDRSEDTLGKLNVQSDDLVDQSHQSCSDVASDPLYSMSHNSQRMAHKCPRCGKCFIYRSQVIRHLRTNKPCAPTSMAAENIPTQLPPGHQEEAPAPESHLLEPHLLKSHTCFQCDTVFRSEAELLRHQRSHRTRTVYQCDQCKKTFHHLSSLSNHKQAYLGRGGFTCGRGEKETLAEPPPRLQHHLACTVCHQTFSSQTLLLRHLQTHSAEGVEPCYSCRFCDQSFSGVTQLRIHQRTHTFRAYKCDQCSKTYSSLTGLNSHRANHANESRFLCPQCGKCFKTRDGLEGHLRRHSGERPYRCPHCPKDFTALAGLNVHVRRHTGERPYVCTICNKGWPSGGDLQKHMRTHTGERPYVCENCGKAFTLSCHLTEHRRIHTGEKPYSCPECGKCLRRKFDLKKHMLSHDSVRPYTCMYCSKSYTRKTHLNRHLLTHSSADSQAAIAEMADEV